MIQPHEIIANVTIVSYNCGSDQFPDWQPTVLDWQDIKWITETPIAFNAVHEPIPLTEKILTEWCGFENVNNTQCLYLSIRDEHEYSRQRIEYIGGSIELARGGVCFKRINNCPLHHLQRLILSLTNEPLKITLP